MDYGLYTQVEQLNKTALKAHGLDSTGQLYKINSFEFYRNEDIIRLTTDPAYDQTAFEQLMEIKGNSDHSKLIEMLDVLNDESSSMDEEVFARYFDPENIAYWLAFQLLTGNTDTQSRNVYLYSPQNSDCWYLLDWDNDGMLRRKEREIIQFSDSESWERGVSNYWGNVLFRRCLQTESFRQLLDTAMDELYAYMNQDRIESMLAHYRGVTEEYVWQMPDRLYVPITHEQYEEVLESIWPEIDEDYDYYWESYHKPMPFYIGTPSLQNGVLQLSWAELNPDTTHPVVDLMPDQNGIENLGGTLRLGSYPCVLDKKSKAYALYGTELINERHRHRFEINNHYRDDFTSHGMMISGQSPDGHIVEMIELPDHPFYVGIQAHPELKSRPNHAHPLFAGFVESAEEQGVLRRAKKLLMKRNHLSEPEAHRYLQKTSMDTGRTMTESAHMVTMLIHED